jgi:hypothetical protein
MDVTFRKLRPGRTALTGLTALALAASPANAQTFAPEPHAPSVSPAHKAVQTVQGWITRVSHHPQPCMPAPVMMPHCPEPAPKLPEKEAKKEPEKKDEAQAAVQPPITPDFGADTQAAVTGGEGVAAQMIGNFPGTTATRCLIVNGTPVTVNALYPVLGQFKIADNESPQPQTRAFLTYNYYNNTFFNPGTAASAGANFGRSDLHMQTLGFEGAFLDGTASVGMRIPMYQQAQSVSGYSSSFSDLSDAIAGYNIGDLTFILKGALLADRQNGMFLSGGLAVTVPTGEDIGIVTLHNDNPWLLQPYVGYLFSAGGAYVHGFSSVVVPVGSKQVTILFNDIGVGYWFGDTTGGFAVVPTIEAHVTTPLNHRGADSVPVGVPDAVDITGGVHLFLGRSSLTFGAAVPLTGPQLYDIEGIVQLNLRF